eukprot:2413717-Pleurochrysis_carterae.AAC.1
MAQVEKTETQWHGKSAVVMKAKGRNGNARPRRGRAAVREEMARLWSSKARLSREERARLWSSKARLSRKERARLWSSKARLSRKERA